jgi:hypothetical protein
MERTEDEQTERPDHVEDDLSTSNFDQLLLDLDNCNLQPEEPLLSYVDNLDERLKIFHDWRMFAGGKLEAAVLACFMVAPIKHLRTLPKDLGKSDSVLRLRIARRMLNNMVRDSVPAVQLCKFLLHLYTALYELDLHPKHITMTSGKQFTHS